MSSRILIVDDNLVIRRSLRHFIEQNTASKICGEAENGKLGVESVLSLRPDLVILDLSMPVMNGLEAAHEITRVAPGVGIVMYTMHVSKQLRAAAEAAGIRDVVSKSDAIEGSLIPALRALDAEL